MFCVIRDGSDVWECGVVQVEGIHEFFESLIRGVKDSKIDYNLRLP